LRRVRRAEDSASNDSESRSSSQLLTRRLNSLLDVHGPSTTSDTACSSGLVVFDQGLPFPVVFPFRNGSEIVKIAVKYLQSGDGESAIISASNTTLWYGLSSRN